MSKIGWNCKKGCLFEDNFCFLKKVVIEKNCNLCKELINHLKELEEELKKVHWEAGNLVEYILSWERI